MTGRKRSSPGRLRVSYETASSIVATFSANILCPDEEKQEERAKKAQEKAEEKAKKAQEKQEVKARKGEEKAAKAEEQRKLKEEQKAAKDEEKAAKAEQQREALEEKRRSKMEAGAATASGDSAAAEVASPDEPADEHRAVDSDDASNDDSDDLLDTDDENENETDEQRERNRESYVTAESATPVSATGDAQTENTESTQRKSVEGSASSSKSKSGVKGWIKNRFSRGKSVSEKPEKDGDEKRRSFFGGASMKGNKSNKSNTSLENRSSSIRDVAMAGKSDKEDGASDKDVVIKDKDSDEEEAAVGGGHSEDKELEKSDSRGVSPVSTPAAEDKPERESRGLEPPKPLDDSVARTSSSPTRDSRFKEEMDQ